LQARSEPELYDYVTGLLEGGDTGGRAVMDDAQRIDFTAEAADVG
jgi:hypothetical protein